MNDNASGPVPGSSRIQSLDVVRGVAVFGILLMNITAFGLPHAYTDPTNFGGATGLNFGAWALNSIVFEGTQRGLFSLLFGAGFILLTSRLEAKGRTDVADIYYRRSIWLIILGMIHAYLFLWWGEILYFYGLTGLFLYPLRKLSVKMMLALASFGILVNAVWGLAELHNARAANEAAQSALISQASGNPVTGDQKSALEAWKAIESAAKPGEAAIANEIKVYHGSYIDILKFQAPKVVWMETWYWYRSFFDISALMLIGMALFKTGALTLEKASSVYWKMVVVGYTVGLAVNYYEYMIIVNGEFSVLAFMRANVTYDAGRLAMTMGHLGLLLLFCRWQRLVWLRARLAAVGRMALSNYMSHSVICAFVFYGFGLGLYGELERYQLYFVVGAIWLFQLILSPIWLARYYFGPVEWLWRCLTYVRVDPFKRATS